MPRSGNEYRMPGTQFQVSEDGINYTTVYTVTDTGSYGSYAVVYADELPEPERSLLVNNEYKFFRFYSGFYSEEEHYSNIAEIEVYGELSQQNKDVILNPKVEGFAEKAGVSTAPAFSWGYAAGDEAKYQTAKRYMTAER